MSTVAFIEACMAAGFTFEQAKTAARIHEQQLAPVRSTNAERQRRYRDRKRAESVTNNVTSVTSVTERNERNEPRAHVEYTSLPSLRSEEVEETPIPPRGGMPPLQPKPNGFARFWEAYPNKTGKRAAELAFAKALKRFNGHDPPGQMVAAIERAKLGRQWREGFVPNPATWLNQDRWDDEPQTQIIPLRQPDGPPPDPRRITREANNARAFAASQAASRGRTG